MTTHDQARAIMQRFTIATGISPLPTNGQSTPPRRYLWTDAFAVCNYLSLFRQNAEPVFLHYALNLVNQVHQTLGRHRQDSAKSGWLSGLDDELARLHPTQGGLRIGKPLNERQQDESIDSILEWQQDGQYYHYLTKWMHALDCVSHYTHDPVYTRWAIELAKVAHRAFVYTPTMGGKKRMYWKMSIDLSRPLVASMGQHDPLDGLVTYMQLRTSVSKMSKPSSELNLDAEINDMLSICKGYSWFSHDPLAIGGLLCDAYTIVQLVVQHKLDDRGLLIELLDASDCGLKIFASHNALQQGAEYRLAFRELGLAIGLTAVKKMQEQLEQKPECFSQAKLLRQQLTRLSEYIPMHTIIENFWVRHENQQHNNWVEHADINSVMLATCLLPEGYLQLTE